MTPGEYLWQRQTIDWDDRDRIGAWVLVLGGSGLVAGWFKACEWQTLHYPYKAAACFYYYAIVVPLSLYDDICGLPGLFCVFGVVAYTILLFFVVIGVVELLAEITGDGWKWFRVILIAPLLFCWGYNIVVVRTLAPVFESLF